MSAFIDTSAFIALLVAEDQKHDHAANVWRELIEADEMVVTSNYIVVETCALLQNRLGMNVLKTFLNDILPIVLVEWIDLPLHEAGVNSLMMSGRNGPNVVDCTSFAVMHKLSIKDSFTFDQHFADQGFSIL